MQVLVVAFSQPARKKMVRAVRELGDVGVAEAATAEDALTVSEHCEFGLVLVSPGLSEKRNDERGLELVGRLRHRREITALIVGDPPDPPTLRRAMRCGASDWLPLDELTGASIGGTLDELQNLPKPRRRALPWAGRRVARGGVMVGQSVPMMDLRAQIGRVARSMAPVLVLGQSGSGKELVVQELRRVGPRPAAPLLDLNCGAIPEALIESQLFGHKRGAFTGAERDQEGYLSAVGRGYLFLDEIAELPLPLQAKLLRVLESGQYRMVGSTKEIQFRGRVVAATHADLMDRVAEGRFREDLYYRLAVLELHVPGLSERPEDIPLLLSHFAARQERPLSFSEEAVRRLEAHPWAGNVRELRNVVTRAAILSDETVVSEATVERLLRKCARGPGASSKALSTLADAVLELDVGDKLQAVQSVLIERSLACCGGNKSAAARALGVHRKVLERWMTKYEAGLAAAHDRPTAGRERPAAVRAATS